MSPEGASLAEVDAEIERLGKKIRAEIAAAEAKETQAAGMRAKIAEAREDLASGVATLPESNRAAFEEAMRVNEEYAAAIEAQAKAIREAAKGYEQARDILIVGKAVEAEAKK